MTDTVYAWFTCPYCGHQNRLKVKIDEYSPIIILCDIDDGPGCDRYFVGDFRITVDTESYAIPELAK